MTWLWKIGLLDLSPIFSLQVSLFFGCISQSFKKNTRSYFLAFIYSRRVKNSIYANIYKSAIMAKLYKWQQKWSYVWIDNWQSFNLSPWTYFYDVLKIHKTSDEHLVSFCSVVNWIANIVFIESQLFSKWRPQNKFLIEYQKYDGLWKIEYFSFK